MATRKEPEFILECANMFPIALAFDCFDIPLGPISENVLPMNEKFILYKKKVNSYLKKKGSQGKYKERKTYACQTLLNKMPNGLASLYMDALGLKTDNSLLLGTMLVSATMPREYKFDTQSVYYLLSEQVDTMFGSYEGYDISKKMIKDMFYMAEPGLIDCNDNDLTKVLECHELLDLLKAPMNMCHKMKRWQTRIQTLKRIKSKKAPMIGTSVYQLRSALYKMCSLRFRTHMLLAKYADKIGDEELFRLSKQNVLLGLDEQIEELEELDESAVNNDQDFILANSILEKVEEQVKSLSGKFEIAWEAKNIETAMDAITTDAMTTTYLSSKGAYLCIRNAMIVVLTQKQISQVITLCSEFAANITSIFFVYGYQAAQLYRTTMLDIWRQAASMSYFDANYISCFQREYEMSVIRSANSNLPFVLDAASYGPYTSIVSTINNFVVTDGKPTVARVKATRTLRQFAFEPMTLFNEHAHCFTLIKQPQQQSLEDLRNGVRFILHKYYRQIYDTSPMNLMEHIALLDNDVQDQITTCQPFHISIYSGVNVDNWGCDLFDDTNLKIKDSTNVPPDYYYHAQPGKYKSLSNIEKREILYYQEHNARLEYEDLCKALEGNLSITFPIRLTVKPEQKEGGRVITMESSTVRRANSVIQSNALPASKVFWGSLMGRSGPGKLDVMQKALEYAYNAERSQHGVLFIQTDFKKFGHTVHEQLTTTVLQEFAKFWGRKWVANFMQTLKQSTLTAGYYGAEAVIRNPLHADGQGMRNATWQMLLLSVIYTGYQELYEAVPELSKKYPVAPVFFMDDHLLIIIYNKTPSMTESENTTHIFNKIMPVLDSIYTRFALQIEPQKTAYSNHSFVLLGDIYASQGMILTPTKGVGSSFSPSELIAPSWGNLVSDVESSLMSAINTGMHPNIAWAIGLIAVWWKTFLFAPRITASYTDTVARVVFLPRSLGGLQFPLPHHLNIGTQFIREIDHHWLAYSMIEQDSTNSGAVNSILVKQAAGTVDEVFRLFQKCPMYRSKVEKVCSQKMMSILGYDEKDQLKQRDKSITELCQALNECPPTMAGFLRSIHPISVPMAKCAKVAKSSTMRSLIDIRTLYNFKALEVRRFVRYIRQMGAMEQTQKMIFGSFGNYLKHVHTDNAHMPIKIPTKLLLLPVLPGKIHGRHHLVFHEVPMSRPVNFIIGKAPAQPPVDISPLESIDDMGRIVALHDAVFAHLNEFGQRSMQLCKKMEDIAHMPYKPERIHPSGNAIPYRDINGLSYSKSVSAAWVGDLSTKFGISFSNLEEITNRYQSHYNYNMAVLIGYMSTSLSHHFVLHPGGLWKSPDIQLSKEVKAALYTEGRLAPLYDKIDKVTAKKPAPGRTLEQAHDRRMLAEDLIALELKTRHDIKNKLIQWAKEGKTDMDAFEDSPFILENVTHDTAHRMFLKEISVGNPQLACKKVWSCWTNFMYESLRQRGVNVAEILYKLPSKFNSYNLLDISYADMVHSLQPTIGEIHELIDLCKEVNVYNEMLTWMQRMWKSIIKGPMSNDMVDLVSATKKVCLSCPGAYVKQLRYCVKIILSSPANALDAKVMKRFLETWRDRYRWSLRERVNWYGKANENRKLAQKGIHQSPATKALFNAIHSFRLAAITYHILSKNAKIICQEDVIKGALQIALTSEVRHVLLKYYKDFSKKKTYTFRESIDKIKKAGKKGKAKALEKAAAYTYQQLCFTMEDMSISADLDIENMELPYELYDKSALEIAKVDPVDNLETFDKMAIQGLLAKDISPSTIGVLEKKKDLKREEIKLLSASMSNAHSQMLLKNVKHTAKNMIRGRKYKEESSDSPKTKKKKKRLKDLEEKTKRQNETKESKEEIEPNEKAEVSGKPDNMSEEFKQRWSSETMNKMFAYDDDYIDDSILSNIPTAEPMEARVSEEKTAETARRNPRPGDPDYDELNDEDPEAWNLVITEGVMPSTTLEEDLANMDDDLRNW